MSKLSSLEIVSFQINLFNGYVIHKNIYELKILDEILTLYGRNAIAQLTFYFHHPLHRMYYLILRNSEQVRAKFMVEFYHYYNYRLERSEMTKEQQLVDYDAVINLLDTTETLKDNLKRFIVNPFQ